MMKWFISAEREALMHPFFQNWLTRKAVHRVTSSSTSKEIYVAETFAQLASVEFDRNISLQRIHTGNHSGGQAFYGYDVYLLSDFTVDLHGPVGIALVSRLRPHGSSSDLLELSLLWLNDDGRQASARNYIEGIVVAGCEFHSIARDAVGVSRWMRHKHKSMQVVKTVSPSNIVTTKYGLFYSPLPGYNDSLDPCTVSQAGHRKRLDKYAIAESAFLRAAASAG